MIILLLAMQLSRLSADEIVERSIAYHDPHAVWATVDHTFQIRETRPDGSARHLEIMLDHPAGRFVYEAKIGGDHVIKKLDRDGCSASVNGSTDIPPEKAEEYRTSCEQIRNYRNYYEYQIGMPMKLRDPGTIIHPEVTSTIFNQRRVLQVRVTYDEKVGSDVWYYYFDPKNYALRGVRFYHDESVHDGEMIIFEDEVEIEELVLPKHRRWYRNRDEHYLGEDTLLEN